MWGARSADSALQRPLSRRQSSSLALSLDPVWPSVAGLALVALRRSGRRGGPSPNTGRSALAELGVRILRWAARLRRPRAISLCDVEPYSGDPRVVVPCSMSRTRPRYGRRSRALSRTATSRSASGAADRSGRRAAPPRVGAGRARLEPSRVSSFAEGYGQAATGKCGSRRRTRSRRCTAAPTVLLARVCEHCLGQRVCPDIWRSSFSYLDQRARSFSEPEQASKRERRRDDRAGSGSTLASPPLVSCPGDSGSARTGAAASRFVHISSRGSHS